MGRIMIGDLLLIVLSLALPTAVIWWAMKSHRSINNKIQQGDISLLMDSGFNIKRITEGPPGTQIYDDATIIPAQQNKY
ncbi:MAG: hypothetical protein NZ736_01215 [Candidatus Poseidoniaceae archaeon]|nr:hypothetical protein [Candidatus Poseidoniaceae archaeon]